MVFGRAPRVMSHAWSSFGKIRCALERTSPKPEDTFEHLFRTVRVPESAGSPVPRDPPGGAGTVLRPGRRACWPHRTTAPTDCQPGVVKLRSAAILSGEGGGGHYWRPIERPFSAKKGCARSVCRRRQRGVHRAHRRGVTAGHARGEAYAADSFGVHGKCTGGAAGRTTPSFFPERARQRSSSEGDGARRIARAREARPGRRAQGVTTRLQASLAPVRPMRAGARGGAANPSGSFRVLFRQTTGDCPRKLAAESEESRFCGMNAPVRNISRPKRPAKRPPGKSNDPFGSTQCGQSAKP
jgi:hypothetical protein